MYDAYEWHADAHNCAHNDRNIILIIKSFDKQNGQKFSRFIVEEQQERDISHVSFF